MKRITAILLLCTLAGCRFARWDGPVPKALATSRQYSQQGVAAGERGQWDRAESLLSQAVVTCPDNAEARKSYAEALWNQGKRAQAVQELQEAIRIAGEDAALRTRLAEMYLESGYVEQAYRETEQAIDLDPKLASAWAVRARVMQAYQRPVEALADFHRALAYRPDDRAIQSEIAELYIRGNQPQRALATLQGLAETYPPGEEPCDLLEQEGKVYLKLARYDDAVDSLTAACNRGPAPTPDILCQLAEAQQLAGRPAEAAETAQRALALDPQHKASRALMDRMELAGQSLPLWRR